MQIKFISAQELIISVGHTGDEVKLYGGRVETFEIAADEQFIGCELDHGTNART